ncbi:hypothetical protein CN228_08665 [Pseudomonas syringae pv. actinidiae str. Shaanxi_M228]|nr:hypothetical protein CN228_08665 [Pseudomonas syringae pv. actinidiae str. Shaanxi_M228]
MEKGNGLKQMEEQGFNGMGNKGKCLTRKGRRVRRKWAATKGHRRQPSKIVHTWKNIRRFTRDCISVQKLRRRSPASSHIRAKLPAQGAILRHDARHFCDP